MSKKVLGLILAGILTLGMVGCSTSEKVDSGSATPTEEKKEAPAKEEKKDEIVLVDDENIKAIITEKKADPLGAGYMISVENKLDKKIVVQTRDTSVDGTMEEPIFSLDIMPGKIAKGMMQFMNVTELDNLKNVEGKLVVMDEDFSEIQSYDLSIN